MASLDTVSIAILLGSLLVMAGILSSLIALRFGAPLLLVFLIVGMLAGEGGPGGVKFDDVGTAYTVGSIALALILFDGGLRTRFASNRNVVALSVMLLIRSSFVCSRYLHAQSYHVVELLTEVLPNAGGIRGFHRLCRAENKREHARRYSKARIGTETGRTSAPWLLSPVQSRWRPRTGHYSRQEPVLLLQRENRW